MSATTEPKIKEKTGTKGDEEPRSLEELLDRLEDGTEGEDEVTIRSMIESVGKRSFGPIILVFGLVAMSPLSGIPTLPSVIGIMVVLVAGQMVIGRKHFWIPKRFLDRSVSKEKFEKGIGTLRPVGRFVDRFLKSRLTFLTKGGAASVLAILCVLVGCTMPPLEILPFLATTAGTALTAFGLSLIARDGLLAIIAICSTLGVGYLAISHFF